MRDKDISFHKSKSGIPLEKAAEAAFPLIIFNAEFVFDHGCDIINDSFELVDFFPFAHDADQRFRTGCTDEDAPVASQFLFAGLDGIADQFIILPAVLAVHPDIFQDLRIGHHQMIHFRKRLVPLQVSGLP